MIKIGDIVKIIAGNNKLTKGHIGKVTDIPEGPFTYYEVDGLYKCEVNELEPMYFKRGFQRCFGYNSIPLPARATKYSAGYDIATPFSIKINPHEVAKIYTGVKAYMGNNEFLGLYIRSSIGKSGLAMVTGVSIVDADYYNNLDNDGQIFIMLRNDTELIIDIKGGTKLVQGIFHHYMLTDNDDVIAERVGGIGSTN